MTRKYNRKVAHEPTELQLLAREQNFEYGRILANITLFTSLRSDLNAQMQKYARHCTLDELLQYQGALRTYDELTENLQDVANSLQGIQAKARIELKTETALAEDQ